ncbi:MAG TPA: hypothetical protein VER35_03290 [Candidatus Limnocylindrales bacterium]|nr:hypothetical protein [Candidatus Limnocylindrales bacterium]
MKIQPISHIESPGGTITPRFPPNIPMGGIPPGQLNNLSRNKNVYLFSWDDIPGNDTGRLIKILKNGFRIEWAETATIEKIDGGKTIKVFTEQNSLLLKLNDEKTRVNLTINDGRTDEFIARVNNSKVNIYKNIGVKAAQTGLFSRNRSITACIQQKLYRKFWRYLNTKIPP